MDAFFDNYGRNKPSTSSDAQVPDSKSVDFLSQLAGMTKFVINNKGGYIHISNLASALSQDEYVVRLGLEWLSAGGHILFQENNSALHLSTGSKKKNSYLQKDLYIKITNIIEEKTIKTKTNSNNERELFTNYPVASDHMPSQQNISKEQKHDYEIIQRENLDTLFNELNTLIGLGGVKEEIHQLIQFVKIQDMRQKKGMGTMNLSLHSVFYGGPGTGKTTVARIYGKMLKALGLLEKGHIIETDRAGLVANYVGQTANKTDEKIKEAMGGVLFIDEAYALYKGEHSQWDYGSEAIEILMKRMEDNRSNLAIIVAGYPNPMNEFLNSNEGFKSRFANHIHFEDYTPEELVKIFKFFCDQNNYILNGNSLELTKIYFESAYARRDERFGNARDVRNMFEKIIRYQALRIGETASHPSDAMLRSIEPQDVYPLLNS